MGSIQERLLYDQARRTALFERHFTPPNEELRIEISMDSMMPKDPGFESRLLPFSVSTFTDRPTEPPLPDKQEFERRQREGPAADNAVDDFTKFLARVWTQSTRR